MRFTPPRPAAWFASAACAAALLASAPAQAQLSPGGRLYDFENLTSGHAPIPTVDGQDHWTSYGYDNGTPQPAFSAGVSSTLGYGGTQGLVVSNGAIQGNDQAVASRTNDSNWYFPTFSGSRGFVQVDLQVRYWGTKFGLGYDSNGNGAVDAFAGSEVGIHLAADLFSDQVKVVSPTGATLAATALANVGGVVLDDTWLRLRLEIDLAANGGAGSGDLYYQNLSNGDTSLQPVTGMQGISLGLDPNAGDGRNPALWNNVWAQWEAAGNTDLDNILIGADTEPNNALSFSGEATDDGDVVVVPDAPDLNLDDNFTWEAWVKPTGDAGYILSKPRQDQDLGDCCVGSGTALNLSANGQVSFGVATVSSGFRGATSTSLLPVGVWSHVAGTYDGQVTQIYVNGVLDGSQDAGSYDAAVHYDDVGQSPTSLLVGREFLSRNTGLGVDYDRNLAAGIDEVRIWSDVRTPAEIAASYDQKVAPQEQGLVLHLPFDFFILDDGSGKRTYDVSGNGHHGRLGSALAGTIAASEPTFISPDLFLSAPHVTTIYDTQITVDLTANAFWGTDEAVSAEASLTYDPSILTVFSVASSGTLTEGWAVETNDVDNGGTHTLSIAAATDVSGFSGHGTLFQVTFDVADVRVPASSALDLSAVVFNDGSKAATAIDGSVTITGTTATTGSTSPVIPRETITVEVTDADENTDPLTVQQISVLVVNGAQTEGLLLDETGPNTGVFSNTMATIFDANSQDVGHGGDGIVQAQRDDVIEFYYDDQLNALGAGPVQLYQSTLVIGGTDGTVDITDATQPGDVVYVRVVDADLNIAFGAGETASVVVTSSNGDQETVVVSEIDVDDEAFFGSIASDGNAVTVGDGIINGAKGDVLTVTYDDVVTYLGDQLDRTATDQVVDPFGDADGNLSVQAFDAAQVLLHVLVPHITGLELIQSNVDTDPVSTGITPFDASLILQKRVGIIGVFPVQVASSTNHPQPTPVSPKRATESRWLALDTADGHLSVIADDRDGIVSGDLLLAGVEGRVELAPELGDFLVASRQVDGGLRVVFAGAHAVTGAGELLRIHGAATTAEITEATLNDGAFTALTHGSAEMQAVPETTALVGNHPNPFNPETQIRFDLASASQVRLTVYDMLGQTVRTLVSGTLPAGAHAVVWDGRNAAGQSVSSGTYFTRLVAGDVVQMQRMMLLK